MQVSFAMLILPNFCEATFVTYGNERNVAKLNYFLFFLLRNFPQHVFLVNLQKLFMQSKRLTDSRGKCEYDHVAKIDEQ